MTTTQLLLRTWEWTSPAWLAAAFASAGYLFLTRRRRVSAGQLQLFLAGIAVFVVALASPLAFLAKDYLFSAHMVQHLLLLLIVPQLVLLAWPRPDGADARPHSPGGPSRAKVLFGWLAGVSAMWLWHIPAFCTASMQSGAVFCTQIATLLGAGAAFWWPIFSPVTWHRLSPPQAVAYLFTGCVACTVLGVYLTFAPVSACPLYAAPADPLGVLPLIRGAWGLSHAADQQLGGLLMWLPACMIYLTAVLAMMARWYRVDREPAAAR